MRHRKRTLKLGRKREHREAMLGNMVCDLIKERRVTTTLAKARAARSLAERMVTLGKRNTLVARRRAIMRLRRPERVAILFGEIAPVFNDRQGGYTRIVKLGRRASDSSEMAILEWVNYTPPAPKPKKEKAGDKKGAAAPEAKAPPPAAKKELAAEAPEKKPAAPAKPKKAAAPEKAKAPEPARAPEPEKPAERKGLFRRRKKEEPPST